jgi:hypothetical protein
MIVCSEQDRKELFDMALARKNSFGSREALKVDGREYDIFALDALEKKGVGAASRLPFSLKVLLENLLRQEDGRFVKPAEIEALANWKPGSAVRTEIAFMPARRRLRIWPRCATPWRSWAATRRKSIPCSRPSW